MIGRHVRLDAITDCDVVELAHILLDQRLYAYGSLWYPIPRDEIEAELIVRGRFLARARRSTGAEDGRYTYVIRNRSDARIVGTTTLSDVDAAVGKGHVGATVLDPDVWGSVVNAETKLLLLGACFDEWGFQRIKIQADARNLRSRAAIERLGASAEGVLRRESLRGDGSLRDVAIYSILVEEWPPIRTALEARIAS